MNRRTLVRHAFGAVVGVTLAAAPGATPALAQKVELAPFVAYRFGGSLENSVTRTTYGINEALAYGGVLEVQLRNQNRFWLLYSRQETEIDTAAAGSVPVTIQYIQGGGSRDMSSSGTLRPFVAGSLGIALAGGEGAGAESLTKFALGMSLGVRTPGPRLSLRGEARAFMSFVGDQAAVGSCGGAGCQIAFSSGTLFQGELALGLGLRF